MSEQNSQIKQMKPYLIIASVLFVILVAVLFWPSNDSEQDLSEVSESQAPAVEQDTGSADEGITDMVEPDVFEAPPMPSPVEITEDMEVEEFEAVEVPVEVPVDTSDATVKSEVMSIASTELVGLMLVNERLLEKFVINVHNLANQEISLKDALVVAPKQNFDTFEQGGRTYIDNASFQRYSPYVDMLESVDTDRLLEIYDSYKPTIEEKFAEISRPNQEFDDALLDAINLLLDTPMVPVPIEVYSESVVYKFKDARIEALAEPQKQLLRTGPENMRRIKDVLRELKQAIESR